VAVGRSPASTHPGLPRRLVGSGQSLRLDTPRGRQTRQRTRAKGYVDEALRKATPTQNGNTYKYIHKFDDIIGTDKLGNGVKGVQVYVRDGFIKTAFPMDVP
jgi:hypothetical protein